jgi:hypothetical protein
MVDGRGVQVVDEDVATLLLDDASEYLRGIIGNRVWPAGQSTVTLWAQPGWQWLDIPITPLVSVDSVVLTPTNPWLLQYLPPTGVLVERFDQAIRVCGPAKVTAVITHGFATIPQELTAWACVLAAQVINSLQQLGTFGSGGVTSLAMEDYKITYQQGTLDPFALPDRVADNLRSRFGGGPAVTTSWR